MAFHTLRLQLRFLLPLALVLMFTVGLTLAWVDRLALRWFTRDLDARGELISSALADPVAEALNQGRSGRLQAMLERSAADPRLPAIGLCGADDRWLFRSRQFPAGLDCAAARSAVHAPGARLSLGETRFHVGLHDISEHGRSVARLVLLHDLSATERRNRDTQRYLVAYFAVLGVTIALITAVAAQLSWRRWVAGARALLHADGLTRPRETHAGELEPLAADLRQRLQDLDDAYRRSLGPVVDWSPDRLRALLRSQLRGDHVIVVSNREPYLHEHTPSGIEMRRPASGLVTAVEPVMRACSGTWIAHGSGSADAEVVDAADRVRVPPDGDPYTLRRLWLSAEEEQGYYYGFANEGLWPLCHVAHVRPVFRDADWAHYQAVNRRFADAVVQEARSDDPVVLVQDYHFALLPALIRERLPQATIITFWHIPWPNPESFGICPWRREILHGLLGSTILGFHTRYHCKNFIETVDRTLEARIEHEHSAINHQDKTTLVEHYPISIAWPDAAQQQKWPTPQRCRRQLQERLGLPADHRLALGVDRFDYTKGILERLQAVERLLEKYPQWIGHFGLLQIAAPTREALPEYQAFQQRIEQLASAINQRWGHALYKPVHLLARHHGHEALTELYRAADVCLVTSLHDGMNLVCKEFVAVRDDEQGVLILSRFAGAARELRQALIVNPYHIDEIADALHQALTMPAAEQRERMASLRMTVREFNVFRWAGSMLADAGRWRLRERIEARVQHHTASNAAGPGSGRAGPP